MKRLTPRAGFTLVEVIVAITLTALVAGLAFGAAQAGIDVRSRLDRVRRDETSTAALREVLHDALRHAERGAGDADTTFALAGDASGAILRVATRGVLSPLGTGGRWAVALTPTRDGLVLLAVPAVSADGSPGTAVRLVAPAVAVAEVRVLDAGGAWLGAWDRPSTPPAAVQIRFLDAGGRDVVPALIARTRPAGEAEDTP